MKLFRFNSIVNDYIDFSSGHYYKDFHHSNLFQVGKLPCSMADNGCTVVNHLAHNPMIEGSNPASDTGGKKMAKS